MIVYATCDRKRALVFLKKKYPNCVIADTPECAGPLLDLIEKDIVRIQDPDFHNPCQVVEGEKLGDYPRKEIVAVCSEFHKRAMGSKGKS